MAEACLDQDVAATPRPDELLRWWADQPEDDDRARPD